ncbi:MAG: helix-turn-helix domain-containing protein [Oscillospiraceae bacterium]|nr:helix-turn-helix domain-containing protein [Oscillospiraceae bacterium]
MNIGENILKMRKEKGITQEQLADVLCISAGAVSKWETEASIPDIAMLPKIAGFFRVSIDKLFDFTLKESDTPENIIKRVREITVGVNYDDSVVKWDNIKVVSNCDEEISILTDACIKFPNNYELKALLCWYKHLGSSKYTELESHKKAEREILDELSSITRLTTDKDVNNVCYSTMCQIYLVLEEYDKAIETAKKANPKDNYQLGYSQAILTSLLKQGKNEEAEKHVHNTNYDSIMLIYMGIMSTIGLGLIKDEEKLKKINQAMINVFKIFSDSPGPFDYYISESYKALAVINMALREYDESMRCFEEFYNYAENFKIFGEKRDFTSDFVKYADKNKFMYNIPYDYKKHLLLAFDAFEAADANTDDGHKMYMELKKREDFQKFVEKLKA